MAAKTLKEQGDERVVEPLIGQLKDSDEWGRQSAAEALRRIGIPEALAAV